MRSFLRCVGAVASLSALASAQVELIGTFDPEQGGAINSIGFDRGSDQVFIHFNFSSSVHVYTRAGVFLRSIPKPSGVTGNDDDIEFADLAVNIGGVSVPPNSLIVVENDNDPPRIVAARASDGLVLAQQNFDGSAVGGWTGGAYHHQRHTFFCSDYSRSMVQEVNSANGAIINEFTINPGGAPSFNLFYSDLDVLREDGRLYLVSDSQNFIRFLSPTGEWAGDIDVSVLGVSSMAGIAFDDGRGEAWVCGQNGVVYHLGGFDAFSGSPCSDADLAVPYGQLDFFDVQLFLQLFSSHDPASDMNSDGVHDFFDVQAFLSLFSAGCP